MIRPLQNKDVEQVLELWLNASVLAHHFIDPEYWRSKKADMRDIYLPASETYVYEHNQVIIGFASLHNDCLAALFVAPTFQGQGLGRQLLTEVMQKRQTLKLTVYAENLNAVKFYEKCGFHEIAKQIDCATGHDEIVMLWTDANE